MDGWMGRDGGYGMESAWMHGMETLVEGKRCPACKTVYEEPERFFVEPVACCLLCYARLPSNRDLWVAIDNMEKDPEAAQVAWRTLCMRAVASRYAKKHKNKARLQGKAVELGVAQPMRGLRYAGEVLSSQATSILHVSGMEKCGGCDNPFAQEDLEEVPNCPYDEHLGVPLVLPPRLCGGCRESCGSGLLRMKCYVCHEPHTPQELYFGNDLKMYCSSDWQKHGRKRCIG